MIIFNQYVFIRKINNACDPTIAGVATQQSLVLLRLL